MKRLYLSIIKGFKRITTEIFGEPENLFDTNHSPKLLHIDKGIYYTKTILASVLVGIILQACAKHPLPYFFVLLSVLLFCILASYSTTKCIASVYKKFRQSMTGDIELLILRTKYAARANRDIIYVPIIFFGVLVPSAAFALIGINLDILVKVYCFTGLSIMVMTCTFGAIQYMLFLVFIYDIKKSIDSITEFDSLNPQETKWVKELSSVSRKCNNFFLLVGLALIFAFCLFSFSGKFMIDTSKTSSVIFLAIFWIIIAIFIIIGAIVLTLFSNYEINKILDGLYDKQQQKLRNNYRYATDTYVKNTFAMRLSLLSISQANKVLFKKNAFSYMLSIINTVASIEATRTLLNSIMAINASSLIDKFF